MNIEGKRDVIREYVKKSDSWLIDYQYPEYYLQIYSEPRRREKKLFKRENKNSKTEGYKFADIKNSLSAQHSE